jgi:sugar (pentulose or hexulose) kinase
MKTAENPKGGTLVIGLDCSTTSTKAIAFDRAGIAVAQAHEPIPLFSPGPNRYEQNPEDWWSSAQKALRQITGAVDPERIEALAISNQRETFVPLAADGSSLRPAIMWLDERCKDEVEPFARKIGKSTIHRLTGKPPDYAPVVYRLAWMKRHEPTLFKSIGLICDVQTYLVWKLTGCRMTSWASADPLGLFDMSRKRWSAPVLNALGLRDDQLPALCAPGEKIGQITEATSALTGLRPGTVVIAGGGDGQAAGLGANVLNPARAYLNLGTAVVAGVFGTRYRTSKAFRTMCSCSDSGYYYECSLRAGTFAIDWLIRNVLTIDPLNDPDIYTKLQEEAREVPPGSEGLFHLPYLCGVMNPYWDMNARGAFVGLSSSHRRGHLYRSILEGIAFEQLSALRAVEKTLGSKVRELIAMGGGSKDGLWCQIIANVTGKKVSVPAITEASALGAATAAAVGTGWFRTFREAAEKMSRRERTLIPDPASRKVYERLFRIYVTLYPRLRTVG